jgi:NADPH-dependent 2,4-dienoyl-CoA reductase/sulfur reductase-like enzyme
VDPSPILLPSLPEKQRRYVLDFLTSQGAEVRLGVAVESFDGRDAVAGGRTYENVFFCWAAGSTFAVPEIRGQVGRLRDGRLQVAPDLSLPNYPHVFAAGDAAAIERRGQPLRKAVNFAFYGGRRAGRNLLRRRRGQPTRPFRRWIWAGWCRSARRASTPAGRPLGTRSPRRAPAPPDVRRPQLFVRQFRRLPAAGAEPQPRRTCMNWKKIVFGADGDANVGLLLLRVFIGGALLTHGWGKMFGGLEQFTGFVASLGVPAPHVMAFLPPSPRASARSCWRSAC